MAEDTTTIIAAAAASATHIYVYTSHWVRAGSQGSIEQEEEEASKASSFHTLNGVANSLRQSVRARLLGASRITPFINATHNLMAAALWGITFSDAAGVCVCVSPPLLPLTCDPINPRRRLRFTPSPQNMSKDMPPPKWRAGGINCIESASE